MCFVYDEQGGNGMRNKRSKKIIALVLMLTMVFSFNAYALTNTMTAQKNGIVSVWKNER